MACRLSDGQVELLFKAVIGSIAASKNNGLQYSPEGFMRDFYTMIFNASGDRDNALDYVQHIPRMIASAYGSEEKIADYLSDSGVDFNALNKLRKEFKDIENVVSFLGLNSNVNEVVEQIIEESNPSTPVIPTEVYTEIEQKDVELKKQAYKAGNNFTATPESGLAVFNQEAKEYDGAVATDNIPDPDPAKKTYYAVVRKLNELMDKYNFQTADNVKLNNVKGIYMKLVKANTIAEDELYVSDRAYINQNEENKAKHNATGLALVYTDKAGNILYFDQEGNVTTKEEGGRLAYGKLRNVYTDRSGQRYIPRVQTVEELISKSDKTEEDIKTIQEQRANEIDVLDAARSFVINNPGESLVFSITPGRSGYIKEDFSKASPISSIQLEKGFNPWVSKQTSGVVVSGGVYFNVPGYDYPVLIQRPKFGDITNLAENLGELLFNDTTQSNIDKINVLKQFVFSNDTKVFERDGKVFVKQGEQELDTTDIAGRETFVNNLKEQTVNVNKDLIGSFMQMPVNLDGKVQLQKERYNNFLSANFNTYLSKNAEGKLVSLNAYNTLFPTTEVQTKLFGETKTTKTVLADELTPIEQNFSDGQGGRKMQSKFAGKSTMDLILSGDRTRTTRANTDIQRMMKDYGLTKIEDLVGKVIRMTDKKGRTAYTEITKVVPFTKEYQDATWQKEGWEKGVTDKLVGQYPYAIEFKIVSLEKQYTAPVSLTETTPTDNSIDEFKSLLDSKDFSLKKSLLLSSEATKEQIDLAEQWFKNSPLSKFVELQTLFNIVNSNAVGEWTTSGIVLYAGSNFTDVYHEAFHAFTQMFLTKQQKVELYSEARKLAGSFTTADGRTVKFNAATDLQLEEFMAEDFRKYAMANGNYVVNGKPARNTIFRRIWNFLKQVFKGASLKSIAEDALATESIQELYDKLYVGNINDYTPSIKNVQFSLLNKGIQSLDTKAEGLNYQDSMTLVETMDSLIASTLSSYDKSVGIIFTNPELLGPLYEKIRNDFKTILNNTELSENAKRIAQFALDNWGEFEKVSRNEQADGTLAFHKKRSSYLTFEDRYSEMSPIEIEEAEDDAEVNKAEEEDGLTLTEKQLEENFGKNVFERKGNELSVRELASSESVYLVKSLPAIDSKTGKPKLNSLGVAKLADFNRTWGIIINAVQGATSDVQMYNKLIEASAKYPEIKYLVDRLGNPMDHVQAKDWPYQKMWISFVRDFSVYRVPIKEVRIINSAETGGFRIEFTEASPTTRQVEDTFLSQFQGIKNSNFVIAGTQGNELNIDAILKAFPYNDLFGRGTKNIIDEDKAFQFLRAIGFYLTDNRAVKQKVYDNYTAVYYLYKGIQDLKKYNIKTTNPISALRSEVKMDGESVYKGESSSVSKILEIEATDSGKYSNNSVQNVAGDREYDLSLNNTSTKVLSELNDKDKDYNEMVSQPHMSHLDYRKNPFAKYSIWLNSLFHIPVGKVFDLSNKNKRKTSKASYGATNVTINIDNLNGIKNVVENIVGAQSASTGIKTSQLDPISKFLMDIHTMLIRGVMELPRHASKSTAYGISVSKVDTEFNQNANHLYISSGYFADKVKSHNATVSLLKPKIAAEMERIAIVKSGKAANVPGFNERGLTFTMFDDILSDSLKNDLIAVANEEDSLSILDDPKFAERISNDINNYINNLVDENFESFVTLPYMSEEILFGGKGIPSLSNLVRKDTGLNIGKGKEQELTMIALRSFTVNALIHNMEAVSVLYGDLAMYNHVKEEFHKRNAAIGSTGRSFSSSESTSMFINNIGRAYANKIGAAKRSFDGILNSVVFKDNKVESAYFEEYVNALVSSGKYTKEQAEKILSPYKEMTEGDAQGWITFDSYRILSLLEGAWSDKQNELYNKIVNDEVVDPAEITEFFPTKKFQYAGPLKTEKLHMQAFHKFSLVPLIPSMVKGTNMETLHDNLVKQGVDYALFESGSKMATITSNGKPDSLYENDDYATRSVKSWNEGEAEYTKNGVFIQYLKDQVDIQSTWKNKTIFSTQLRTLIINDLFKQGIPISKDFELLVSRFEKLLDTLQEGKKKELLEQAGWKEDAKGNLSGSTESLMNFVQKELDRQGLPEHDIDFIKNFGLQSDLSFSLNAEKIEKLLNSIVVKRLVRQKMNGEQLVQVSGAGFESGFKNPTEDQLARYGTNDLPTYRPGKGKNGSTSAMKVKIAMKGDYYKLLELKHTDGKKIGTIERLNEVLKKDEWLDKNDNRKLITMVGVRIPVQGFNSMEFMEVYEFLPEEAGSIIVPPTEIVAKSGSDFDIDKLTIFQPNYKYDNEEATYATGKGVKAVENQIIETIRQILEHPDNFDALIRPNDTDIVKGVADELSIENIQGYNPLANKTKEQGSKISPTRTLEPRYNLYKHESNNIGKRTLGIGAVDNKYSSIFKRVGARLEKQYTHYPIDPITKEYKVKNGKVVTEMRPINIRMKHNTVTKDGKSYISLSDVETVTGDKISDLISQLMNGWVDIEKDAWIFNINGNNVAGPVLLFLLETGVDFKTAAYFVSQPLVIKYIKDRAKRNSPFYEAAGNEASKGKGYDKFNVRKEFIIRNFYDDLTIDKKTGRARETETGEIIVSNVDIYRIINKYNDKKEYTTEELLNNIKDKNTESDISKATLLHFIELEDLMAKLTNIKLTVNLDTAPSKSLFSAQERLSKISKLNIVDAVPSDLVTNILYDSPIKSFLVQAFQLKLWKPLMKLRGDETVNNYLINKINTNKYKKTFEDAEKYVAAFKNDIPMYLMQNYIKGIDLKNIKEYKGLLINKSIPIEKVQIKYGAFVKDGVMYVDPQQIALDFDQKEYAGKGYESLQLAKTDIGAFQMGPKRSQNLQEYTHFVLEREYLRSVIPMKEKQSREEYEQILADRALERTFNFYTILKSKNSIADDFLNIKRVYSELEEEYMLMDQISFIGEGGKNKGRKLRTLKLKSDRLDSEIINVLHENLVRLSDVGTLKVADKTRNLEISKFFSRLIIAEYLRAGINKSGSTLSSILPTETLMKLLEEPMKNVSEKGISQEFLDKYSDMFDSNWSSNSSSSRLRYRNYIQYTETTEETVVRNMEEGQSDFREAGKATVYDNPRTNSEIKAFETVINSNKESIFVYPTNQDGIAEVLTAPYKTAGNSVGIPIKQKGGSQSWSDETYDNNIALINQALEVIDNHLGNGAKVVFPSSGLTTILGKDDAQIDVLKDKAPRTYTYLVSELYKKYGYVNPGAESNLGFRKEFQSSQPITDEEIESIIEQKVEESKNCNS